MLLLYKHSTEYGVRNSVSVRKDSIDGITDSAIPPLQQHRNNPPPSVPLPHDFNFRHPTVVKHQNRKVAMKEAGRKEAFLFVTTCTSVLRTPRPPRGSCILLLHFSVSS
jgi:hypothetical protein